MKILLNSQNSSRGESWRLSANGLQPDIPRSHFTVHLGVMTFAKVMVLPPGDQSAALILHIVFHYGKPMTNT